MACDSVRNLGRLFHSATAAATYVNQPADRNDAGDASFLRADVSSL